MKTFIIIMLSISILSVTLGLHDYIKKYEGSKAVAALIFLCAFILALIFTCKL